MKKLHWLFGFCLMVMVIWGGSISVCAGETDDFFYGENDDGTIFITRYIGSDETVTVPSELDGKTVKSVGGFTSNKTIKHVIISEGIIELKNILVLHDREPIENTSMGTFMSCENLESVTFPSTLETIGKCAFFGCQSLKTVVLPDGLLHIDRYAFVDCKSLERLVIPDSVNDIGNAAFDGNTTIFANLDSNSYIKEYLEQNKNVKFSCIKHTNIINDPAIPATCTREGKTSGSRCADCGAVLSGYKSIPPAHKIVKVNIPATCTSRGEQYTYCKVCNKYVDENGKSVVKKILQPTGHKFDNGVVIVAPSVIKTGLKLYTCKVCGGNKTEIIPKISGAKTGTSITDSNNSYKITQSDINQGTVEYISTASKKDTIVIPDTIKINGIDYKVTSIGKNAFKNNKKLKKITIGSNITKINAGAFNGCKNLKIITIKTKNLKSIGKNAFKGIKVNAKIKVPSSKLKKYQKLCKNKGQKSTVKITI